MNGLITESELMIWLNFNQTAALKRCLDENKIHYIVGKNGQLSTTLDAVNSALGLKENHIDNIEIEF